VLVDVSADDANVDPDEIAKAVTRSTRAIVPVHFAGLPCDLDAIYAIARNCGARVLEDAAHAIGARYGNRRIGEAGDAVALSFYATKNMTTGEGGALVTNDRELSDRVRTLTLHGMTRDAWHRYDAGGAWRYDVEEFGYKDNLADFAAALGRSQLRRIDAMMERRRRLAARYLANLGDLEGIILPAGADVPGHAWHLFVIRVRSGTGVDRAALIRGLADRGIGTSVHFIPVHTFSAYRRLGLWEEGRFPIAEQFFQGAVSLPLYPDLSEAEVDDVCQAVREIVNGP
ncbi:MAG: DegT/DnrJ/EryC1/StrS family aminotransferase, partial [Dehalococcoidia bacterium]